MASIAQRANGGAGGSKAPRLEGIASERHRADSLAVDERVQRSKIPSHVKKIIAKLNRDGIGVIHVSRRADGGLYIIDGQHRVLALVEAGHGSELVDCRVYHGLSLAEEAALYRLLNTTRASGAWEDYKVGLVEGDSECLAIEAIAARLGLSVTLQSGEGFVSCVAAMQKLYRSKRGAGPAALGFALSTAVASWGTHSDSVDGHVVTGLGHFYLRYGEEIDRKALIRKLAKYPGGAPGLIGNAKGLRAIRPGSIGSRVAILVVDLYNRGRRDQFPPL